MIDTPRTDAASTDVSFDGGTVSADFARTLERELTASRADAERLMKELERADATLDDIDTCSDAYKPDLLDPYVKNVLRLCLQNRIARRALIREARAALAAHEKDSKP
jgi:hypothetical protein